MVFESLVADLLNKYLGDYVENLDRSQLKIGIWGGDVVLHDLSLKQSALDELNLPIKTVYGYLGKLVLKIPWKNLYNAPVEAQIDKLFILAIPNTSIKYNAEKEENWLQEEKQNELGKIELAKKAELEKGKTKQGDNSFTEKLVTQIVRNVQISIKNIHIRYEDDINRPGNPIAVGVTLHSLSLKSINSWGDPTPIDPINLIFKELVLQCLSVYWNSNAQLFSTSKSSESDYKLYFEQGIATKDISPIDYKYILGPINSSSNLRINSKPELDGTDFTVPQVLLKFEMESLLIRVAKVQLQDILVLLDSFHRMSIQTLYRKYRPYINTYRGHYKEWWKFAYNCIVETEIRRRKRNWNWFHIIQHRDLCREYAVAYKAKISTTKPGSEVVKNCQNMERQLDVLNIILIRERIELEVAREGKAQEAIKEAQGGWFSRWWGGGAKADSPQQEDDIVRQFQDAMTGQEKEKLYKAIGYQESASPTEYPPYFVVVDLSVVLHRLQLEIVNQNMQDPHVLTVRFSQVACRLEKRPQSLSVNTYVKLLSARGSRQGDVVPRLVEPKVMTQEDRDELDSCDSQLCLFKCLVEMAPLDELCDQRIHVVALPLKIIYDAVTINNIVDVFTLEEKAAMQPIQAAAQNKLAELKQKSALGLQHVIDMHSVMDLQVDIMASYIIVPNKGFYQENAPAVVMNLGRLQLHSQPRPKQHDNTANVRALYTQGHSEEEILAEMISKSYDNFVLQLSDLQVLFTLEGESWDFENSSPAIEKLYLLKPTSLTINLSMCFIEDDPRLPKMKLDARLPLISFHFVENRLIKLVKLLLSIPVPEETAKPPEALPMEMKGAAAMGSTASLSGLGPNAPLKIVSSTRMITPQDDEQIVQMTEIVMNFELKEVTMCIMKGSWDTPDDSQKLVCFKLVSLEASMEKKTFDLSVSLRLGGASLVQTYSNNPIHILKTPMTSGQQEYLLSIKYVNVDRNSPEFHSKYGSVLQLIDFDFTKVELLFHQEAILYLMNFTNNIQAEINLIQRSVDDKPKVEFTVGQVAAPIVSSPSMVQSSATYSRVLSMIKEEGGLIASKPVSMAKAKNRLLKRVEVIDLKITVCMRSISVGLATHEQGAIIYLGVTGGIAVVTMKKSYTQIEASLMGVNVKDNLLKDTRYSQILTVIDDKEALVTKVVLFNDTEDRSSRKMDIQVKASMACVRFIFLNRFISSLMNFLNNFQAAQDVIVEASHAAAEAAKHNVQDVYTNAIRVALDIKIKAPIIVVPVNTVDADAFLLDLGFLSLSNNIVDIMTADSDEPAALDNLQLDLQNLKLSRIVLNNELKIMSERLVLKPISFKLNVQRNLSSGWYTAIPDLEIGGQLHSIHLIVFKEDYSLLMRVLKENLGDGVDSESTSIRSSGESRQTKNLGERSVSLQPSNLAVAKRTPAAPDLLAPPKVVTKEKVNVAVKFYFTMESLMVEIFSGDASKKETVEGLAEFKLLMICVRGSLLSDNSIQLSLLLMDCILDDTRPSQSTKIKRYMEKKVTEHIGDDGTSAAKTMIDIVFQQKGDAMFVDLRVSSFVLILNLEHLMQIVSIFNDENTSGPAASQHQPRIKASPGNVSEKEVPSKFILTLNLKLEHPDIILVEKMDDINTSALMFQAEIIFKLRMLEDSQFINGSITDMQLFSCCYNPVFRKDTKAHVLRPFSILLSGCSPQNVGLNVDISTTNIRISVSADTLQLLNNILSTASQSNQVVSSRSIQFMDYSEMWKISPFNENDYAFLTTEVAQEVTVESSGFTVIGGKSEICIFSIPSLVVTVESGTGLSRIPMLLLETSVQATIKDWSSQLNVDSHLGVKLSYYNHSLALWEPLIEPVEEMISGQSNFYPWEINLQVETNKPNSQCDVFQGKAKPEMSIYISSKEMMSITITKSCLEVLSNLSASFTDAIYKPTEKLSLDQAQFVLINNTGLNIRVFLKDSDFLLYQHTRPGLTAPDDIKEVQLDSGAQVELCPLDKDFIPLESSTAKDRFISIKVMDYDCEMEVPVMRADKRFFLLNQRSASNDQWGIVSDVTVNNGVTCITLRSIIQVINHFNVAIRVYYMTAKGNELKLVGNIEPNSTLNLPLKAIYTPTSELFFSVQGYTVSIMPFVWKDLQRTLEKTLLMQCNPKNREEKDPFYIKAVGEIEQVYFELTNRHTMASNCYNIHMRPAVVLKNILPVDVLVCAQGVPTDIQVRAGESLQLPTIEPGTSSVVIRIPEYLDREWTCKHEISASPTEFSVWSFESYLSPNKFTLDLGVHSVDKHGSIIMSLYCPFWMVNNTGLLLAYRQSDDMNNIIYHPKDLTGPVMFSFHSKTFFAKKKSCIRVGDGSWSDKFSLDVAGSSGVVMSKCKDMQYQIGVHIRLTYNTLTKQIRFTPYYIIVNNYDLSVELKESNTENTSWILVNSQSCSPFWPVGSKDDGCLVLRIQNTMETTIPFYFCKPHTSVLKIDNQYGALYIDVQITEGMAYITVFPYENGMAPALILNHTNTTVDFRDKSKTESAFILRPMERKLFCWETSDFNRLMVFADGKGSHTLREDGIGEIVLGGDENNKAYWVSFLYGLQRVLLLTRDSVVAQQAHNISDIDTISQEIEISIHGIGVSLVNNLSKVEVLYLGITSSGVIWEAKKANKNRFKQLSSNDSNKIEAAFGRYTAQMDACENPSPCVPVDQRINVNFETNEMLAPVRKVIRRRYNTGLWVLIKSSPTQLQFHAKVNRVQIDNQMSDCVFPVIFFPVPPPKSIAMDNIGKPFVEMSIMKRLNNYSAVQQYKYFKLLIQEFHVKVDICFINALLKLFEEGEKSEKDKVVNFMKDLKLTTDPLMSQIVSTFQDQKNVYDILHLSPLKIHVSFSLSGGNQGTDQGSSVPEFITVFAQSFGVTVTDIQDVVFKLAYFERQNALITQGQLVSEVQQHYISQLLKQIYVLVLGLDVIGNPFGLVMGFTQGATDLFYEPFQGAIQGPGEFAEGLVLGVRSLFGHTVGGAAGAFSKITGAMGKGLAALSFDKEYQRQRREAMSNKPQNVQEGLAQSGKGLVMGVVEGVGGVITKPISGAKEEGVQGFFKGVGKGIMGLVTRPTAGVIDFASGSFSAVKRVTDTTEEVTRMRVARHFDADGLVKPYSKLLAEGNKLLMDLDKGKYLATDVYVFHMPIGQGKHKDMLLITDQRVAYLSHNEIFGGYQMEWFHVWSEMLEEPKVVPQGVALSIIDKKKGIRILAGASTGKVLLIHDEQIKKFLVDKMIYLMNRATLPKRSSASIKSN